MHTYYVIFELQPPQQNNDEMLNETVITAVLTHDEAVVMCLMRQHLAVRRVTEEDVLTYMTEYVQQPHRHQQ